jgi:hypothetical protein
MICVERRAATMNSEAVLEEPLDCVYRVNSAIETTRMERYIDKRIPLAAVGGPQPSIANSEEPNAVSVVQTGTSIMMLTIREIRTARAQCLDCLSLSMEPPCLFLCRCGAIFEDPASKSKVSTASPRT